MTKTILLADDSATIRKIAELTFSDSEIRVETVESGTAALERFETLRPDLVLADVVMPEPTGYEVCRSIKSSDRSVPVLLLTGTFEPFDAERARDCGADGHMIKPFESRALMERVEALLFPPEAPAPAAEEAEQALEELTVEAVAEEAPERVPIDEAPAEDVPGHPLTEEQIEAVALAVARRLADDAVREYVRRELPALADRLVRERIQELEAEDS